MNASAGLAKYVTVKQMRAFERRAIDGLGIPAKILMENAGSAAAAAAADLLKKSANKKVICLCGGGNNGGDGFVCARHLTGRGFAVTVFLAADPALLKGCAALNFNILRKMRVRIVLLKDAKDMEVFKVRLKNSGLVVDALFGIGLNSPVRELPGRLIGLVNGARRPVLSIDVPSGLDADSGRVLGGCIKAHTTVTFAYPKTGFRKNHGPRAVGRLIVADIF